MSVKHLLFALVLIFNAFYAVEANAQIDPDVTGDGVVNTDDIDVWNILYQFVLENPEFEESMLEFLDVIPDGNVALSDRNALVFFGLGIRYGDANADGAVDFMDLQICASNLGTEFNEAEGWTQGNFNGDFVIDRRDLLIVLRNLSNG